MVVCHCVVECHILVALCGHAYLRGSARLAGGGGRSGSSRRTECVLRGGLWFVLAPEPHRSLGRQPGIRRLVDAGRDGARYLVDRLWLGRYRLCAYRRTPGLVYTLGGGLWRGCAGSLVRHVIGLAGAWSL